MQPRAPPNQPLLIPTTLTERFTFKAYLQNARVQMQIDIGLGDVVFPTAVQTEYPTFVDFPLPILRAYGANWGRNWLCKANACEMQTKRFLVVTLGLLRASNMRARCNQCSLNAHGIAGGWTQPL